MPIASAAPAAKPVSGAPKSQQPLVPRTATSEIDRLRAELAAANAKLAAANAPKPLRFQVSDKGGLSVYGINKQFPVTLYIDQWERVFEAVPQMKEFIAANRSRFKVKAC